MSYGDGEVVERGMTGNVKYWDKIKDKAIALRMRREKGKRKCIEEAKKEWLKRHTSA